MAKKNIQQLAYTAIRIEGGLIPAEELTRLTTLAAPEATEQTEAHYGIPKGAEAARRDHRAPLQDRAAPCGRTSSSSARARTRTPRTPPSSAGCCRCSAMCWA